MIRRISLVALLVVLSSPHGFAQFGGMGGMGRGAPQPGVARGGMGMAMMGGMGGAMGVESGVERTVQVEMIDGEKISGKILLTDVAVNGSAAN